MQSPRAPFAHLGDYIDTATTACMPDDCIVSISLTSSHEDDSEDSPCATPLMSVEGSPAPSTPPRTYAEQYPDGAVSPLAQPQLAQPVQSPGSSTRTGTPASPDLAHQSTDMATRFSEGPTAPSAGSSSRTYAFVSLAGSTIRKRPRKRYDETERLYSCSFDGCTKAYGTLNHLNAHVTMLKHGPKRDPSEFKELRKLWRSQKGAEGVQSRHLGGVEKDDSCPGTP